ncbi:MAG: Ldh family oxidoreductase [Terriglobia bacterium]
MPILQAAILRDFSSQIFHEAGADSKEAARVAGSLVEANLVGHDSHGVLRIPEYVRWMEQKLVTLGAHSQIVYETDTLAIVDGGWGFGQVIGEEAMTLAIQKAAEAAIGVVSVRQCCHIGRAGEYPQMAADKGMAALLFVNTHGGGKLVAPWGGRERRLSANPIAAAIPRKDGWPILVDLSTCSIAEGKVRTMLNKKVPVPPGNMIDAEGNPTTDPTKFYGPPEGALLPFGGHKGFALGLVTDILAGALSGAGCSRKDATRVGNAFLAIVVNVSRFRPDSEFHFDVEGLIEFVKSSALAPGFDSILIPGEPEANERAKRLKAGIPIDDETWRQITEVAHNYGVQIPV